MISLLIREWKQCLHDPRRYIYLFGAALVYMLIFSILFKPNVVDSIPTVIYDAENSFLTRKLVQDFTDGDRFRMIAYCSTEEEMKSYLRNQEAYIAIYIPEDFSKTVKTGKSQNILLMVDSSDIMIPGAALEEAEELMDRYSDDLAVERLEYKTGMSKDKLVGRVRPVTRNIRVLANPVMGYEYFYLLGLLVAAFQQGIFFTTGAAVQYELEKRTNLAPWKIAAEKVVYYTLMGMVSFSIVLLLVLHVLHFRMDCPLSLLMGAAFLYTFATASLGVAFSACFHSEEAFCKGSIMYPLAGFILSGYTWPVSAMPESMQLLVNLLPQTVFANMFRELLLQGHGFDMGMKLLQLFVTGIILSAAAVLILERKQKNPCPEPASQAGQGIGR